MKLKFTKQIFIITTIALLLIPTISQAEEIKTDSIKIDRHWIYLFQQDNLRTFEIREYFLINNTGEAVFNDSILISIQNNSIISQDCCNYTLNMANRYNASGCGECFDLNKLENSDFFEGYPFIAGNSLSFYGQKEKISVTIFSTTNTSLNNDTLLLNATIGGLSIARNQEIHTGRGIHITSENLEIGMLPLIATYTPYYITTLENITISNNSTDTELIEFNINNLPDGWTVEIWNNTEKINNVSLSPQEYQNLTLKITAPSNIASIYIGYITQIDTDSKDNKGIFTKQYLYDTKKVTYDVYLITIDDLKISDDLEMVHGELFWLEEYERYWFIARNEDIYPNNYSSISMNLKETIDTQPNPYLILATIFILILIIITLIFKKIGFFTKKDETPKQKAILEGKKIKDLEDQKKNVLLAIKRVEKEYADKTINKKDYERFRSTYKKRAIEILKEIDRLKK